MSVYPRTTEKKRIMQEYWMRHEDMTSVALNRPRPLSPKAQLEQEKRIRREIANSNERRRMQSINAGFQSLKTLLPHHAAEKLSKAAILQQTSEYISSLERDKTTVMAENDRLRQQLMNINNTLNSINAAVAEESPPPKRKKRDTESSDEGIGLCEESTQLDEMRKKLLDIQLHFDQEKRMRLKFEDRSRALEAKLQKLSNHVLDKETVMSLKEVDEKPSQPLFNTSMSRRNLETIVEAIRHLEGDRIGLGLEEQHPSSISQFGASESYSPPGTHQPINSGYNGSGERGVVNLSEKSQHRQKKLCSGAGERAEMCSEAEQDKDSYVMIGATTRGDEEDKENCCSKDGSGRGLLSSSPVNEEDTSDDIDEDDDVDEDEEFDEGDDDDLIDDDDDEDVDDNVEDCNDCVAEEDSELLSPVDFSTTGQHQHHHNTGGGGGGGHKKTALFSSTVITTTTITTTASTDLSLNNNNTTTSTFSSIPPPPPPPSSISVLSTTPSSTSSPSSLSLSSSPTAAPLSSTSPSTLPSPPSISSILPAAAASCKPSVQHHHHNQQQHPARVAVADTPAPPSAHSPVLVAATTTATTTTSAAPPSSIPPAHQHQQQRQLQQPHRQQQQQQQHHHHHHHHHHSHHQQDQQKQQHQVLANECTSVVKTLSSSSSSSSSNNNNNNSSKYSPTVSTLLHRAPPYNMNQIYQRPGVIVHKS